jgi:hypothetical protein
MGGPPWTLEFVRLPDFARQEIPTTLQQRVHRYKALIRTSQAAGGQGDTWNWNLVGGGMSAAEKAAIKAAAQLQFDVPTTTVGDHTFADFSKYVIAEVQLPMSLWGESDRAQFRWLNEQIGGERDGYTWHHHQDSGRMQLVLTAAHDSVKHAGGRRADGGWATGGRS